MISPPLSQRRLLVPRWRSLCVTLSSDELAAPCRAGALQAESPHLPDLGRKIKDWSLEPGLITAGEVVGACLVEAQEYRGVNAAMFLTSSTTTPTSFLRHMAEITLERAGTQTGSPQVSKQSVQVEKALWRQRTRLYPMNALAWVELALHDVIVGKKKSARRHMLTALKFAPDNRHVLRSASRLFLHLGDPERAYDIIERSHGVESDPWLMAAEVAIAELVNRKPQFVIKGRRMVADDSYDAGQITELAGAIGTLELSDGRRKRARDLFRKSLQSPTGSALAQAEWASPQIGLEPIPLGQLESMKEAEEAKVFHFLREEQFEKIPQACVAWSRAEPYSARPYEHASGASCMIGNHKETLDSTEKGLRIRGKSEILLNNRAFALIHVGRLAEADAALMNIQKESEKSWFVREANLGLLAMRQGRYSVGRAFYETAIRGFRRLDNERWSAVAAMFCAREAALAGMEDSATLVREARANMARLRITTYGHVIEEAKHALKSRGLRNEKRGSGHATTCGDQMSS